jgi:hypothetical protein
MILRMKKKLQKILLLLSLSVSLSATAQNQVYWREGFEPTSTPPSDLTTTNPTNILPAPTTNISYYFTGIGGSWFALNAYRTTGNACPSPYGANHPRFRNMGSSGTFDSGYLVTPVVEFGIQEFHFTRTRATRNFSIWITDDTSATTTNWTFVHRVRSSSNICNDSLVTIASASAKRLKIVANPGIDSDIDSLWLTSFDQILPVKFGGISATTNGGIVKLNWQIESEINTNNYTIERSVNGRNFIAVGTVEAKNLRNYVWIDNSNLDEAAYRIRAVDKDGKFAYSNVIKVKVGTANKLQLTVAPNPVVNGKLNLQVNGISKGNYNINIYSLLGKLVYSSVINSDGNILNKSIDLPSSMLAGNYIVELKNGISNITKSILIQ